ncbi:hypothetical protein DH2020_045244 [Rehmannia glutinosa]|uniref:ENTH domain-containing protein n=1 Tax=Rehmannia glutinosa TaxID=99300 RepID=A0ABR0UEP4_REHGL
MAPSKIRKAIGAVKDRTSIGLAKVSGSNSCSDLEVAIVKATSHDEYPPDERYICEILSLTTYSHALVSACVGIIAKRLNKTRNWAVALKTLMLVHRLLSKGDHAYDQEIFFSTRRGTRFLNMSDFRDASGKSDASGLLRRSSGRRAVFGRAARVQDAWRSRKRGGYGYNREEDDEEGRGRGGGAASEAVMVRATPVREMKNESVFSRAHHLKQILERFLACKPTGAAKHNRVVVVALYPIVKESFQLYYDITEIMGTLIERFMQLEVPDMVQVYEIFCRVSKQFDQLDAFYDWCKTVRIMRSSECPNVEKIPKKKLDMMDDFIHQKSAMSQNRRRARSSEPKPEPEPEPIEQKPKEDMHAVRGLPPLEGSIQEKVKNEKPDEVKELKAEKQKTQEIGDLLNLHEDNTPSTEEQGDKLALALFDGGLSTNAQESTKTPWEAFKGPSGDWETALVHSASHLSNQKASFPGGFDTMTLDGMYQHRAMANSSGPVATGSASSVALGSTGRPTMLALPAPPAASGGVWVNSDPFAASLAIAPPSYVQMSEMEKQQRLLVDEQLVWQQYARYGMPGQIGLPEVQKQNSYQYVTGGYTRMW